MIVGIDIGTALTKVVELGAAKAGGHEILAMKYMKTPCTKEGEVEPKAFWEQMEGVIPFSRLRGAQVSIGLPSISVNFTCFDFPRLPKNEMPRAVQAEARKKILPVPGPQDNLKYMILKETKLKEGAQMTLLAGAAEKSAVDKYHDLFKNRGITPIFIGSTAMGLFACFSECYRTQAENWAFMNIGFKSTVLDLFIKGKLVLVRIIPFAGTDILQAVAKQTKLDAEQAEQMFMRNEVEERVFADSVNYLLTEIRRSFAYYKSISSDGDIDALLFSGGIAAYPAITEFIKQHMRGRVEVFDLGAVKAFSVKRSVPPEAVRLGPLFLSVLGLGLAVAAKMPLLNFLPEEEVREKKAQKIDILFLKILGALGVVLVAALAVVIFFLQQSNARAFPPQRQEFIRVQYEALSKKAEAVALKQRQFSQQINFIEVIKKFSFSWEKIFTGLSESVPSSVFLKELELTYEEPVPSQPGLKITLRGAVKEDFENGREQLEVLAQRLRQSGFFTEESVTPFTLEEVVIQPQKKNTQMTMVREREFTIAGRMKKP